MSIKFTKMHGLGNDFVVIDAITQVIELTPKQIRALGHRHTGIGFDQLLLLEPPDDPAADFRCRIFNADGSEAEQCGNGMRCCARFVRDRSLTRKTSFVLQTPGGLINCLVHDDRIEVDMGQPCFAPEAIPFETKHADGTAALTDAGPGNWHLDLGGDQCELTVLSMGNPHAVLFVDEVANAEVARMGGAVQAHPAFPMGVNVGFCQVMDRNSLRLRVYERGVGETCACGSGACAAVVAAVSRGCTGAQVQVSLPGGTLDVEWSGSGHAIRMTGPTATVFKGRLKS